MWSAAVVQIPPAGLKTVSLWHCGFVSLCQEEKNLCLFEPVQVVCLEGGEAHVVAAGAPVAGGAGGAGHAHFVGSFSDPVTPERQRLGVSFNLGVNRRIGF